MAVRVWVDCYPLTTSNPNYLYKIEPNASGSYLVFTGWRKEQELITKAISKSFMSVLEWETQESTSKLYSASRFERAVLEKLTSTIYVKLGNKILHLWWLVVEVEVVINNYKF